MLAGIGKLPDTVASRAIPVELARATRAELKALEPARGRTLKTLRGLHDALSEWGATSIARLTTASEPILDDVSARQSDIWGPLLAIATDCGGDWLARASAAARRLHAEKGDSTDGRDAGIALLADLRAIFEVDGATYIRSARLAELLRISEDRPWPEFSRGGPITTNAIARLLRPFGIAPQHQRTSPHETTRAYFRAHCTEAFKRYLPPEAGTTDTNSTVEVVPIAPVCGGTAASVEEMLEPLPF